MDDERRAELARELLAAMPDGKMEAKLATAIGALGRASGLSQHNTWIAMARLVSVVNGSAPVGVVVTRPEDDGQLVVEVFGSNGVTEKSTVPADVVRQVIGGAHGPMH